MNDANRERIEKLKLWALQMLREAREATLDFVDEFKRSTIYFKARVGVVAGFVVLVGLTLAVARPPEISNPISARVLVSAIFWGESLKTLIEVTNESGDEYKPLIVVVEGTETDVKTGSQRPGRWKYTKNKLRAGDTILIEAKHLTNEENEGPAIGFTPSVVEVRSADGVFRTPVTVRTAK